MAVERVGRYEIERVLGRGAMGVVYLARDPLIDRQVALKTLRVDIDADQAGEFRERFLREARAAGRLNHPNIVMVHDVGEDPATGLVFIAMEFVEGRDLKQILAGGHRFRPSEAARIVAEIASALDYAHQMKVVHRDVKPANIILTTDGTAKITDFGVARLESSNLTVEGQFIGTPNFMSPEQITGRRVDGRSDLFSLGVVLYNLLTGQRPFVGETMHEATLRIVQQPCPIPSTVDPQVPPAFNPIVLKALEKSPDRRFQRGSELAEVLAALARSLVDRRADDGGRTGVYSPDLGTRVVVPPRTPQEPPAVPARSATSTLWTRLTIPSALLLEVRAIWSAAILAVAVLLAVAAVAPLLLRRDAGPFPTPSSGASRAAHLAAEELAAARSALEDDRPLEARHHLERVLDHTPASPAARSLLTETTRRLELLRTSEQMRVRVEELLSQGRDAYRRGRYSEAAGSFTAALELDPGNELATSFLELAEERQRAAMAQRSSAGTTQTRPAARSRPGHATAPAADVVGTAQITVSFNSPLNAGAIVITKDAEVLTQIPFDFTTKGLLGIRRRGTGSIQRVVQISSGEHRIGIELHDSKRGVIGRAVIDRTLPAGSEWSLRIDLPRADGEPSFFLVPRAP